MGKILVVDDEVDLREILAEMLNDEGLSVITAEDGADALVKIIDDQKGKREIYAVVSDINMPRMNGLKLLESINDLNIELPFIVLTGYGDREKIMSALRFGAFDFQDKPFDRNRLMASAQAAFKYGEELKNLEYEVEKIMENIPLSTLEDKIKCRDQIQKVMRIKFERKSRSAG